MDDVLAAEHPELLPAYVPHFVSATAVRGAAPPRARLCSVCLQPAAQQCPHCLARCCSLPCLSTHRAARCVVR